MRRFIDAHIHVRSVEDCGSRAVSLDSQWNQHQSLLDRALVMGTHPHQDWEAVMHLARLDSHRWIPSFGTGSLCCPIVVLAAR
jgi:hypothetical protein